MLYLQIASPKSSVLNFLDSNSFEVIISIFQRTEKVPDMERLHISLDFTHNIICMSMHTNIFNVTSDATIRFKADLFLYDL